MPTTPRGARNSPGRPTLAQENQRLWADVERLEVELEAKDEHFDREVTKRLHAEAERTLAKVEEMWRLSIENDRLKAAWAAAQAALGREQAHVKLLQQAMHAMDVERAAELHALSLAQHRADEADRLEKALATFNRHSVGLCHACAGLQPITHKKLALPSASYLSGSPRFGKGHDHARCGAKMSGNPHLSSALDLPGPGAHESQLYDNRGSLYSIGRAGTVEPYSSPTVPLS